VVNIHFQDGQTGYYLRESLLEKMETLTLSDFGVSSAPSAAPPVEPSSGSHRSEIGGALDLDGSSTTDPLVQAEARPSPSSKQSDTRKSKPSVPKWWKSRK
jgi:hypothetical protein